MKATHADRIGRVTGLVVLVVGNGGREHALAWALDRDPEVSAVHIAPGNPGTAQVGTNHPVDPMDGVSVAALARELGAGLVVIGPEAPLVAGVADAVRAVGIPVFGPSAAAARLEGSKAFAKEIMEPPASRPRRPGSAFRWTRWSPRSTSSARRTW